MDTIHAILTRRSVRRFKGDQVPEELLEKIIKCGLNAPSSKNTQPWKLTIIQNPEIIKKIGEILINSNNYDSEPCDPLTGKIKNGFFSSIRESGEIIKTSPLLIIVENTCPFSGGRKNVINSQFRDRAIGGHDSEFISLGAAIENMCLAIHALGLATVIIADVMAEEEKIKNVLNLEGDLVVILPVGYPAYIPGEKRIKEDLVRRI